MYRQLRTFSTYGRQLSRLSLPVRNSGDIQIQRVRFVRPFFRRRFWLKSLAYSAAASYVWVKWTALDDDEEGDAEEFAEDRDSGGILKPVPEVERAGVPSNPSRDSGSEETRDAEETEEEEFDEDELVPEEPPEDAWFIPLWMARERPMEFYKATDPEWVSYVQFNQDLRRRQKAKVALCAILGQTFSDMKDFQGLLGAPIILGKQWLEFFYPHGPPPEWERLGVEVADEYIAILHRPVEARNVDRLKSTLWPVVAGQSLWASCNALWKIQVVRVQVAWDSMNSDPEKWRNQYLETMSALQNSYLRRHSDGKAPSASNSATAPVKVSSWQPQVEQSLSLPLPSLPQPNGDLKKATSVFRGSFAKNTKLKVHPPRGTILVHGLIELVGSKGICVLDVQASYDPNESRYVTIQVAPRSRTRRKLMPRG